MQIALQFIFVDFFLASFGGFGTVDSTKTDEFSEKFQNAFDPPPSFSENYIAFFLKVLIKVAFKFQNLQYIFSD